MKRQRDANTRTLETRILTRSLEYLHHPESFEMKHTKLYSYFLFENTKNFPLPQLLVKIGHALL